MRKLVKEMEIWMEVRERTARQEVSKAKEKLERVLEENAKVKTALGVGPKVASVPPPRDEPLVLSQDHLRGEENKPRSPHQTCVRDREDFRPFEELPVQQPYNDQDTKRIASLEKELDESRLQAAVLHDENMKLESAHKMDRETIEGLRLEMQEAIFELDALRTRHIPEKVHSSSAPVQRTQPEEVYAPPTPSITPQGEEPPHHLQTERPPAQSSSATYPPKAEESPKVKRKKRKAAVVPTPVKPRLFVDPTNPQESLIQLYQQKMYLLQVKVHSRLPVDIGDIPWPVFPPGGKTYPIVIHGRKGIKSADVMEFAKTFWIGGNGLAKERAAEMIFAWSWMCPPGRVECAKNLRSWIGRTTTFLLHARKKLGF